MTWQVLAPEWPTPMGVSESSLLQLSQPGTISLQQSQSWPLWIHCDWPHCRYHLGVPLVCLMVVSERDQAQLPPSLVRVGGFPNFSHLRDQKHLSQNGSAILAVNVCTHNPCKCKHSKFWNVCKASRKWHTSKSQPPFTCWLWCVKFWFQNTVCWGSPPEKCEPFHKSSGDCKAHPPLLRTRSKASAPQAAAVSFPSAQLFWTGRWDSSPSVSPGRKTFPNQKPCRPKSLSGSSMTLMSQSQRPPQGHPI